MPVLHRLQLATRKWEALPGGPALQGLNLVAHEGRIYRAGGMEPRNAPGTPQDIHSVAGTARFSPATRQWEPLPALPEPRSSHGLAVIGDTLYLVGGWRLQGGQPTTWAKTMLTLDLSKPGAAWQSAPQPFERRATIAAVHGGRLYLLGGITPSGAVSRDVEVYDPQTKAWSKGPALPGPDIHSFAPGACVQEGKLYVSLGDGGLHQLNDAANRWEEAGRSTPRLAHRMVAAGGGILLLGGASKGKNFDLVETVQAPGGALANDHQKASLRP